MAVEPGSYSQLLADQKGLLGLSLTLSLLITWGIGLTPPLLLRYKILKRPLDISSALAIAGALLFINVAIFTAIGGSSQTHGALVLIAIVSYYILRSGSKTFMRKMIEGLADKESVSEKKVKSLQYPKQHESNTSEHYVKAESVKISEKRDITKKQLTSNKRITFRRVLAFLVLALIVYGLSIVLNIHAFNQLGSLAEESEYYWSRHSDDESLFKASSRLRVYSDRCTLVITTDRLLLKSKAYFVKGLSTLSDGCATDSADLRRKGLSMCNTAVGYLNQYKQEHKHEHDMWLYGD